MAAQTARLLGADVVVAVTGSGGPAPQDGQPPGTVWIAWTGPFGTGAEEHRFEGDPAEVVAASVAAALRVLAVACLNPARDG